MDDVLMRIGEIAAFFKVSVKAMRIYEKMGILTPVKIDDQTGYRYYCADQVRELDALLELRELGFSLAEIQKILGGMTSEQYMEALVHKKMMWEDKIAQAQSKIEDIDAIIQRLREAKPPTKLHELTEDERAHLISRMAAAENLHGNNVHVLSEAIWLQAGRQAKGG